MATREEWRRWWERQRALVEAPAGALLARVEPGPDTAHWMIGAGQAGSTAAAAVVHWLCPPDTDWAFVPTGRPEVVPVAHGALIGYAAPDGENPVCLADMALEAARGTGGEALVAARLAEGTPAEQEESRRCLMAGLPPHWPPDGPPMGRGAILKALRGLQAEGRREFDALAVKAIEATTLTLRWRALEPGAREEVPAGTAGTPKGGGELGAG